jgi:acyl-CoA oxidase
MISLNSSTLALSALTIAIRYACVRRQFAISLNTPETLLIDYPLTRRRLLPLLAQTVIYLSGNIDISQVWDKNFINILNPENTVIQELHAISSTTKPKSSWFATETIKECRQVLGGHGYSYFSKLAVLYNDNDVNCTWEGDNNILLQQATKYVLDCAAKLMKGKPIDSQILSFLTNVINTLFIAAH